MDELTRWLATKAGIEDAVAEKTIGIILGFLRNEGPSDKVQALIDKIPGAEAAASSFGATNTAWASPTFRTLRVNFSGSAEIKSVPIKWARSSQEHPASASSLEAYFMFEES